MRIVRFMRTFGRLKNYLLERARYLTMKKIANIIKVEWAFMRKKAVVHAYPYEIVVDPTNICQLRCPLCPTGSGTSERERGRMDSGTFRKIIDEMAPWAVHVYMHNWGEPLLLRDIADYIAYAKNRGVAVSLSSNLSFDLPEEKADAVLRSGLDTLVVSLDGTSPETYGQYRVAGDFDRVMRNLKLLVRRKKETGLKRPFIEWQFLVMKHNAHEISKAREMSREIGVDNIAFGTIVLPFGVNDPALAAEWFPPEELKRRSRYDIQERDIGRRCWWLWRGVVFNWDGSVYPCCYVDENRAVYGNINGTSFPDIWNGSAYVAARNLFSSGGPGRELVCSRCGIVATVRGPGRR